MSCICEMSIYSWAVIMKGTSTSGCSGRQTLLSISRTLNNLLHVKLLLKVHLRNSWFPILISSCLITFSSLQEKIFLLFGGFFLMKTVDCCVKICIDLPKILHKCRETHFKYNLLDSVRKEVLRAIIWKCRCFNVLIIYFKIKHYTSRFKYL